MNNRKPGTLLPLLMLGFGALLVAGRVAADPQTLSDADLPLLIALDESALTPASAEPASPPEPAKQKERPVQIEEIVVTASKRQESARTLAGAVTAVGRSRLDETGSSNFADYLSLSPGVNLNSGQPGQAIVTIRGVSTDTLPTAAQTAVGIYYDDIPLTDPGTPVMVPDIDAYDAERIEIMRGPQGALFGSSSLGGAINFIPQAPDPSAFSFSAQASGAKTENADLGYSGKLMANMPLIQDEMALRLVGYHTDMPGWIDNVGTGIDGANAATVSGGRAMLGWSPAAGSTLRLTGLHQEGKVDDTAFIDDSGDLRKNTLIPEETSNQLDIASLRYDYEAQAGTWSLIAGHQKKDNRLVSDQSAFLGIQALGVPVPGVQTQGVDGYSVELRFASAAGERFDYLAGLSYADRDEDLDTQIDIDLAALGRDVAGALLGSLGLPVPDVLGVTKIISLRADLQAPEAAAFVDMNWRITPDLKLSAGGRYYRNTVDADIEGEGVLYAPTGSLTFSESSKTTANGFNPKVSLSYLLDMDAMVYALYSRGYRLGGINLVPDTPVAPTKTSYGSDQVNNFELGAKTSWLDGALVVDVTGFYIDWKNIPLQVQDRLGLFKYLDNIGDARIYGVETSLIVRPADSLTLRSAITWNKATLENFYDPQNGRPPVEPGDQLPGAPEWTISNALTGRWFIADLMPVVTLIHRYEGTSPSSLSYSDIEKGGYHQFDLRAGVSLGGVGVTLFGKNLADERGVTAVQPYARATGGDPYRRDFVITPRTFGVELEYLFNS
jgi:iron complex outermembrane receptor protein